MNKNKIVLTTIIAGLLSACGTTQKPVEPSLSANIPSWVLSPVVEDSIAATDCVKLSGNFSIDKRMATANSRVALAQQLDLRVEALEKTYSSRVDSNDATTVGSNFSSVSKQLTKQKITGSRVIKSDIVNISGKEHFCVLTTLNPLATRELFDEIIKQSKRAVNPQDEKFLYQEFKAHKAESNLDKEIKRLTK